MSKKVKRIKYDLPFRFTDKVSVLWSYKGNLLLIHTDFPEDLVEGISTLSEFVSCMRLINLPYERLKVRDVERKELVVNRFMDEGYRLVEFYA